MKILDLGCGSGYLTFPIAKMNENTSVIGLDIVTDTLERNRVKAQEMGIKNLEFVSYTRVTFPFGDDFFCIDSYQLTLTEEEIWVTEQVNNLLFEKNKF